MKQTLFLMVGYPGSGKTTVSRIIQYQTDAVHIWADEERKKRFKEPAYSHEENLSLYADLNDLTDQLLSEGKSVIFDTNFNFYKDRQHLRELAAKHGVKTVVVWVITPQDVARQRAVHETHTRRTRVLGNMPNDHFERIAGNLQFPQEDELTIKLDGTNITATGVAKALKSV
jgi:predicted kinase